MSIRSCYKSYMLLTITLLFSSNIFSQWKDVYSEDNYRRIGTDALEMAFYDIVSAYIASRAADQIEDKFDKLSDISSSFRYQEFPVKNFIDITTRNYMQTKLYPLNPLLLSYASNVSLGNVFVRRRLNNRYNKEIENIDNYFNALNPLTEGERMYLTVSAIYDVLQITLEGDNKKNEDDE